MRWVLSIILAAAVGCPSAFAKEREAAQFFEAAGLHRFHLIIPHQGWEGMQPGRGTAVAQTVMLDNHEHALGRHYRYARAVLEYEGKAVGEVGVRFKGNSSYVASDTSYKRPMKVDLDRVEEGREFFGLDCLNFNNNAIDPSLLREHLSYALFRDAGVPAPRTALAAVTLSVDPLVREKRLGVYTIVEEVDKKFLKSRFGSSKGLLLKPEGNGTFSYRGNDAQQAMRNYSAKTETSPEVAEQFLAFLRLLNSADDATFAEQIEWYVEMEEFLRFLAVNVLLSNYDSFLGMGHNFYVYVHPTTLKAHFVPWDLNLSFGGYVRVPPSHVARTSVNKPCVGSHRLVDRVLKVAKYRERYLEIVRELNGSVFEPGRLIERVERLEAVINGERDWPREPSNPSVARGALADPPELKAFVRERHASVAAQLSGDVSGVYEPRFVHGPITGYLKGSPPRRRSIPNLVEQE
jgi:hypothetical protein